MKLLVVRTPKAVQRPTMSQMSDGSARLSWGQEVAEWWNSCFECSSSHVFFGGAKIADGFGMSKEHHHEEDWQKNSFSGVSWNHTLSNDLTSYSSYRIPWKIATIFSAHCKRVKRVSIWANRRYRKVSPVFGELACLEYNIPCYYWDILSNSRS